MIKKTKSEIFLFLLGAFQHLFNFFLLRALFFVSLALCADVAVISGNLKPSGCNLAIEHGEGGI
jgi:hypothetical protein